MTREEAINNLKKILGFSPTYDEAFYTLFPNGAESSLPSDVGLEKYASRAGFDYVDDIEYKDPDHRWNDHDVEYAYRDGIINGANWQKAKMLEEAVEGYVNYYEASGGILMAEAQVGCPYHNGDKVKVIVVKEEQK